MLITLVLSLVAPALAAAPSTALHADVATADALSQAASANVQVVGATWLDAHHAAVLDAWRADPDAAATAWSVDAGETRAGTPRFADPVIEAAGIGPVFLERLVHGDENAWTRTALVDLVWRLDCDWQPAVAALYGTETDPVVRGAMVHVVRKADASVAGPLVALGLADADAEVRATALQTLRYLDDRAPYADAVVAALADTDSFVRMEAARTAGRMELEGAWSPLVTLLADERAEVRLRALRALEDISPTRAARQPEIKALHTDADFKVARAAAMVAPE